MSKISAQAFIKRLVLVLVISAGQLCWVETSSAATTELLTNSNFSNGTTGWASSTGFMSCALYSGSQPCVGTGTPSQYSSGWLYLSYTNASVTQNITGINAATYDSFTFSSSVTTSNDTWYLLAEFKSSSGTVLYSLRSPTSGNYSTNGTNYAVSLTLNKSGNANFSSITSISITINGMDSGYWAGNYGPQFDYVSLVGSYTPDSTPAVITGPGSQTGTTNSVTIQENSSLVHTYSANEAVTWSKSGTDGGRFTISSVGLLSFQSSPDFENKLDSNSDNTYLVTVTATDGGGNITSQALTVTVSDVNEAPVISNFTSLASAAITLSENIAPIVTYSSTDQDAGTTLQWSLIGGVDSARFNIETSTGELRFGSSPDFEAPTDNLQNNTYIAVIQVSDGTLSDSQTITVTITDAVENSVLSSPSLPGVVSKGVAVNVTIASNAAGRVTFLVAGKRIPNCSSIATSGSYPNFTATCSWKPTTLSAVGLVAKIAPLSSSFNPSTSGTTVVRPIRRTTLR